MNKIIYRVVRGLFNIYMKLFRGLKIEGREYIPKEGRLLVAANHTSNLDPPLIGVGMTRYMYFMAKKELFKNKFIGWFITKLGAFPIDREKADLEAIKTSLKILKRGGVLGVFPEGTRSKSGKLGKAQPGIVRIALKAKAPILPCALINVAGGKRPVIIRFGKPITLEDYYGRRLSKEETEEVGRIIMAEIQKLLDK